jgi:signal transduction histidine kinase
MATRYDNELILAVIIGTIVFFILVGFSVSYFITYKRKRTEHQVELNEFRRQFENQLLLSRVEVQEQTFQLIGKELHDNVGQLLSTARMLLGLTERSMDKPPDTLLTANETVAEAIAQLRSLSKSLDKEWLEQFNFSENLQYEIDRINSGRNVQAIYNNQYVVPLKPDEQIILFRIVQEAIQNAVKHANPTAINIQSFVNKDRFVVVIADDGAGFEKDKQQGMGLNNMKHRTLLLGGTIAWDTAPGNGTQVTITLPYNEKEA